MKIIFTLFFIFSSLFAATKVYRQGNFVFDKKHNLLWQDTKENIRVLKSQAGATEYCEKLVLGRFSDWRLPSRDEYLTIIDKTRIDEEMTIHKAFKYNLSDHYWTSDRTWRNFYRWGYYIYFKSGTFYYENKNYPKYVRCVHDY